MEVEVEHARTNQVRQWLTPEASTSGTKALCGSILPPHTHTNHTNYTHKTVSVLRSEIVPNGSDGSDG